MPEPEYLTISQASRALGVPERSARRAADKLADNDRQKAANGRTLVRLSALASQMGLSTLADNGGQTAPSVVQVAEELADKGGQDSATVEVLADNGGQADGALIEQLRSENAHLREQVGKWEAQAEKALQLLDQAQRLQLAASHRVAELEGKLLPAGVASELRPVAGSEQTEALGTPGGDSSGSVLREGESIPPISQGRVWWQFWRKG